MCRPAGHCPRLLEWGGYSSSRDTCHPIRALAVQLRLPYAEATASGRPLGIAGDTGAIMPS